MNHGKADAQLDAASMARLDPALGSVERREETATGMAQRVGGKSIKINFVRTERGWKLSMPES